MSIPVTIAKIGLGIGAIGAALTVLELKNATKEFVSFEKAIVDAASKLSLVQSGLTFEEAKKSLGDLAMEIGRTTIFTAEEAAKAINALVQTGREEKEIFDLIGPVVKFAAANHIELSEAALDAVLITRSFNMEMNESGRVMDVLTAAAIKSTATVDLMREAMKFGSRSFAVLGFNIEETAAVIAKIAATMRTGSISGTTFSQAMVNIAKVFDETKKKTKVREDLKKLGVDFALLEKAFSRATPPGQKLAAIIEALEPLAIATQESVQNFALSTELLQIRGSGILPVLREGAEAFKEFQVSLTGTNANQLIYNRTMDTTFADIKLLESAWSSFRINLVSAFSPALRRVIDNFTDLIAVMGPIAEMIGEKLADGLDHIANNFGILEPLIVAAAGAFGGLLDVAALLPSVLKIAFFSFKSIVTAVLPFAIEGFATLTRGLADFIRFLRDMVVMLLESDFATSDMFGLGLSDEEVARKISQVKSLTHPMILGLNQMGNAAEYNKEAMTSWADGFGTAKDNVQGLTEGLEEFGTAMRKGFPTGGAFAGAAKELFPAMAKAQRERGMTADEKALTNLTQLHDKLASIGIDMDKAFAGLGDLAKNPQGVEQALSAIQQIFSQLERAEGFEKLLGYTKQIEVETRKIRVPVFTPIDPAAAKALEALGKPIPGPRRSFIETEISVPGIDYVPVYEQMEQVFLNIKEVQQKIVEQLNVGLEKVLIEGWTAVGDTVPLAIRKAADKAKKENDARALQAAEAEAEGG